jgi:hypothetical protein
VADVVIENPILNSPYLERTRHFRFDDDGITNEPVDGRRISAYFIPIAQPKKKGKQLVFEDWTGDRIQPNDFINRVRERVGYWRAGGYQGVTRVTRQLLEYRQRPERERPLFFCQIEAVETAIYLAECATRFNDAWIANGLKEKNEQYSGGLDRLAFKMATGSGEMIVMAMLIAWRRSTNWPTLRMRASATPSSSSYRASPSATAYACSCPTTRTTITASSTLSPSSCASGSTRRRSPSRRSRPRPRAPWR